MPTRFFCISLMGWEYWFPGFIFSTLAYSLASLVQLIQFFQGDNGIATIHSPIFPMQSYSFSHFKPCLGFVSLMRTLMECPEAESHRWYEPGLTYDFFAPICSGFEYETQLLHGPCLGGVDVDAASPVSSIGNPSSFQIEPYLNGLQFYRNRDTVTIVPQPPPVAHHPRRQHSWFPKMPFRSGGIANGNKTNFVASIRKIGSIFWYGVFLYNELARARPRPRAIWPPVHFGKCHCSNCIDPCYYAMRQYHRCLAV